MYLILEIDYDRTIINETIKTSLNKKLIKLKPMGANLFCPHLPIKRSF